MKKNLVYYKKKIDRSKFFRSLWHEKFLPEHVQEMEQLRWEAVKRYQVVLDTKWREIFRRMPASGIFYGIRHYWSKEKKCYEDHIVVFKSDGYGISNSYAEENDSSAIDFVRCLDTNQLPKYINSGAELVRGAVIRRLRGDENLSQYENRQDLVDLYYRSEVMSSRVLRAIGYYDSIIKSHYDEMVRRINRNHLYPEPRITLSINNRLYIFEEGKLSSAPEDGNYVFFESDLSKTDPISKDHVEKYQFGIVESNSEHQYQ